ncbi:MAG: hypothetical protein ACKOZT_04030 [Cyanobium sp.]
MSLLPISPAHLAALGLRAARLALLPAGLGLLAASPLQAAEVAYPPATTFRTIQLETLNCGRENTPATCEQARKLADPLLDHPRLSTSCKDALWAVRQKAITAPSNTLERRDPIDKASRDVGAYCRQPYVPQAATTTENPGGKPFSLRTFTP